MTNQADQQQNAIRIAEAKAKEAARQARITWRQAPKATYKKGK